MRTSKIIDRLLYQPEKHKQKFVRSLRKTLESKSKRKDTVLAISPELIVGAMNVRGLDGETNNALRRLVEDRGFDVRPLVYNVHFLLVRNDPFKLSPGFFFVMS